MVVLPRRGYVFLELPAAACTRGGAGVALLRARGRETLDSLDLFVSGDRVTPAELPLADWRGVATPGALGGDVLSAEALALRPLCRVSALARGLPLAARTAEADELPCAGTAGAGGCEE